MFSYHNVLFVYYTSPQELTGESPFFLMYGRDPVLPTADMLAHPDGRIRVSIDDYKEEIAAHMMTSRKRSYSDCSVQAEMKL